MKQHKNIIIAIALIFCTFLAYHFYQEQKMNSLHHTYETSLAKALKNSYKDIEEIHFDNPYYSDKPGGWDVNVNLVFTDGTKFDFETYHKVGEKYGYSPSFGGKDLQEKLKNLRSRHGKTITVVMVYYSDKKVEEIRGGN